LFTLIGLLLAWQLGAAHAQEEEPEYAGTRECRSCHRSYASDHAESPHGMTLIEIAEAEEDDDIDLEDVVLGDFEAGEEVRTTTFADGETRPFTLDDVFFTLGAGRHYQAYVTEVDDGVYRVLPAQWSTIDETWVPLPVEGEWAEDPAYDFNSQCAGCHTTQFNAAELEWEETGVQCETCHGPGLEHVELADDAGGSISEEEYEALSSAINFGLDSQVCGQCHVRGVNEETGLPVPVGYLPGDNLIGAETFTPYDTSVESVWYATGHASEPNMQYNEWLLSSHTNALESAQASEYFEAACLQCHSVAQIRAEYLVDEGWVDDDEFDPLSLLDTHGFGITCASCHNPHEEDNAVYLREEEPVALCVACHSDTDVTEGIHHPVVEMYEGQELVADVEPVPGAHASAEDGPTCNTCHMQTIDTKNGPRSSHTFHPVSPAGAADIADLQDACTTCHTDVQNPVEMQGLIDNVQANVETRLATLRDAMDENTPEWVQQSVAAVEGDGSLGVHNYAYTNALLGAAEAELGIASATVSNNDVSQQIANTLPDVEVPEVTTAQLPNRGVRGLTPPSLVLLGIAGGIVLIAGYSFFLRGGRDD
jgi:predicted CXXCH cytochrome family protein